MDSSSAALVTIPRQLEDPLEHLPFSTIVDYPKGSTVYSAAQFSTTLFLVMDGRVKVSRVSEGGRQFVVDIYHPDEFFGEAAFLNMPYHLDQATALENTKLMTWTADAVEELLRLYTPYRGFAWTARRDVEIGGRKICAGEAIALVFTSANRDEDRFERAEEFDIHLKIWGDQNHRQLMGQLLPRKVMGFASAARFHLMRNGERLESTGTDEMGEFHFTDLPEGALSLQIDLPNLTVIGSLNVGENS